MKGQVLFQKKTKKCHQTSEEVSLWKLNFDCSTQG